MTREDALAAAHREAMVTQAPVSVWRHLFQGRYITKADALPPPNEKVWMRVLRVTANGVGHPVEGGP